MARASIGEIAGMKACREALQELSRSIQRGVGNRALMETAEFFAGKVKAKAPVSTRARNPTKGSLRDSVRAAKSRPERGRPTAVVLADDIAAVPNEFGTSKMSAQPFFRPAVDANREAGAEVMARALKSETEAAVERAARKGAKGK